MEPIKIEVTIGLSEEAKEFLAALAAQLAGALIPKKPVKKAPVEEKPAKVEEEPAQVQNEPVKAENVTQEDEPTREDARLAVNKARDRGIDNARIKACIPNGKMKLTDLTPDEIRQFIKSVEEL